MDTMEMDDNMYSKLDDNKFSNLSRFWCENLHWWRRPAGVAAVCLGLLSVLLLTGIIGLVFYCNIQSNYNNNLTEEKDQLQTSYNNLTKERDQLQTSYNHLTKERDQLQTSYNTLNKEKDQLQTNYNNLTKERDQLQTRFNNLTNERDQLQTSYNNLTNERDQLRTSLYETPCLDGWRKFGKSCYYLSSTMETAGAGQKKCRAMGGELVVIDSREEQIFIYGFKKSVWIGLYHKKDILHWIDGKPLETAYWMPGEPSYLKVNETCVEISQTASDPLKSWKDGPCVKKDWVCEKAC